MNNVHILKKQELESEEYSGRFEEIKKTNPNLYQFLNGNMKETSFLGVREDVFDLICEKASEFVDEYEFAYNVAQFSCNTKMEPAWFDWFNKKYQEISEEIPIIDFCLIMNEAVEKNVPLEAFEGMYEKHGSDLMFIFEDIDNYEPVQSVESEDDDTDKEEKSDVEIKDTASGEEHISSPSAVEKGEVDESELKTPSYNREPEYAEMFNSLLTVMEVKRNDERPELQENVQKCLTQLSVYFSDIFRLWDNDRDEIERLQALYKLQQKVLFSQQKKMNEMRNVITELQFQVGEASKLDMKREELRKKISEIQSLMSFDIDRIGVSDE